ncbi:nuclear transport factor 2 family protein [Dokdonia sp. Hel_I_53]|uniref:nuclear transport factor 2 family protein n=1 Tax=Dokdonia sp. Hel_I_53 TaxID=1566287 RepID=UPI00119B852A|nr:nuclear transport factor 2 family protein [Dokdonia sp. Hel_I_53]TVZ51847.1 hypothetical protein OD90_1006 [Dokdonia sp. Hel_I_53]
MKLTYLFIPMICVFFLFAFAKANRNNNLTSEQEQVDEVEVQKAVEIFFEGFHSQDSLLIKKVVHQGVMMQSIGKSKSGDIELSNQNFNEFLKSICSIPDTTSFSEVIHGYEIKMDGKMANVWTPYSFLINGNLSHCGTNSFQLFKRNGIWKIFYIVDTRSIEGCGEQRG